MGETRRQGEPTDKKEPEFDLAKFLGEPKTDYSGLIDRAEKDLEVDDWLFTNYSSFIVRHLVKPVADFKKIPENAELIERVKAESERERSFLGDKIKGKILVDVACGHGYIFRDEDSMSYLAQELGAQTYIGVDRASVFGTEVNPTVNLAKERSTDKGMQMAEVKADALDFLSRLPDNSVCITVNGLDHIVVRNREYHKALAKEIMRVLCVGGVVFGTNSESLDEIELLCKGQSETSASQSIIKPVKLSRTIKKVFIKE